MLADILIVCSSFTCL